MGSKGQEKTNQLNAFNIIARHFPIYIFVIYTVSACKFRPQESQGHVGWSVWLLGHIFGMPPLLSLGLQPASPGPPTVLTKVHCLSLKPDMDGEVRSHPDSRINDKVQSWELGLSRVLRPDDPQNHPKLRHVRSIHYRLRHQSHYWANLLYHYPHYPLMRQSLLNFPSKRILAMYVLYTQIYFNNKKLEFFTEIFSLDKRKESCVLG